MEFVWNLKTAGSIGGNSLIKFSSPRARICILSPREFEEIRESPISKRAFIEGINRGVEFIDNFCFDCISYDINRKVDSKVSCCFRHKSILNIILEE